jgi:acyl-CoA synthetase (AMP-forming)/AMP-acid ligase II
VSTSLLLRTDSRLTSCQVFHTSGSTGMPKPVTFVHSALAAVDSLRELYSEDSYRVSVHRVIDAVEATYNGCPLFHTAGFVVSFFLVFSGCVTVIGPPDQPSSPQMFKQILHSTHTQGALLPPLVIDQIAEEPAMVEEAAKLKFLTYGGGKACLIQIPALVLGLICSRFRQPRSG